MDIKQKIQFGDNTDELAGKVLSGEKTATSSLHDYYRLQLKEMSNVGDYAEILDSNGKEVCIVEIEKIEIIKFKDITERFAMEEGDGSLDNWLKIHTHYYSGLLAKIGKELTSNTELVCEWFKVVKSDKG